MLECPLGGTRNNAQRKKLSGSLVSLRRKMALMNPITRVIVFYTKQLWGEASVPPPSQKEDLTNGAFLAATKNFTELPDANHRFLSNHLPIYSALHDLYDHNRDTHLEGKKE